MSNQDIAFCALDPAVAKTLLILKPQTNGLVLSIKLQISTFDSVKNRPLIYMLNKKGP